MEKFENLINFVIDKQPLKFQSEFDEIIGEKIAAKIEDMKIQHAMNYFNPPEDDESESDEESDEEIQSDDEFEDFDFDDFSDEELETVEFPEDENE